MRWSGFVVLALVGVLIGGFLRFADLVSSMGPPPDPQVDAIVVLTGGSQRIDQALDLLAAGIGKRLLISGVHPTTSANQIRRITQSSANLFKCCVDIGYNAMDTIGNANEAVTWIADHRYTTVLVVTNNYHMPRSLYELRRVDPETTFVAYPVVNSDLKHKNWFTDPQVVRTMLAEYMKLLLAIARTNTGFTTTNGLRTVQ